MLLSQLSLTCSASRTWSLCVPLCPSFPVLLKCRGILSPLGCWDKSLHSPALFLQPGWTKGLLSGHLICEAANYSLCQVMFWNCYYLHKPLQTDLDLLLEWLMETNSVKGSCKLQQVTSRTRDWKDVSRSVAADTWSFFLHFPDPGKWKTAGWEPLLSDLC